MHLKPSGEIMAKVIIVKKFSLLTLQRNLSVSDTNIRSDLEIHMVLVVYNHFNNSFLLKNYQVHLSTHT